MTPSDLLASWTYQGDLARQVCGDDSDAEGAGESGEEEEEVGGEEEVMEALERVASMGRLGGGIEEEDVQGLDSEEDEEGGMAARWGGPLPLEELASEVGAARGSVGGVTSSAAGGGGGGGVKATGRKWRAVEVLFSLGQSSNHQLGYPTGDALYQTR
jgi:hypothetical protein